MNKPKLSDETKKRFEDFEKLVFQLRYVASVKEMKVDKEFYSFLKFYKTFTDAFENDKMNPIDYSIGCRTLYIFGIKISSED